MSSTELFGLVWYSAYEEYEIVSVYRNREIADLHCKALNQGAVLAGIEDEAFKVVPVTSDTEGWVVEIPTRSPTKG